MKLQDLIFISVLATVPLSVAAEGGLFDGVDPARFEERAREASPLWRHVSAHAEHLPIGLRVGGRGPDSAGGAGVCLQALNLSNKPIKYATVSISLKNAVGDTLSGRIRGRKVAQCQITGPIDPRDQTGMVCCPRLIYAHSAHCVEVVRSDVEFMDGTIEAVTDRKKIRQMTLSYGDRIADFALCAP